MARAIKQLEKRIENVEIRLEQLQCEHRGIIFRDCFREDEFGEKICADCGKRLQGYGDKAAFLREKLEYETRLFNNKVKRIEGEIEYLDIKTRIKMRRFFNDNHLHL